MVKGWKVPEMGQSGPWYVIQTEPRREPYVLERLRGDGFQPYFPRIRLPDRRIAPLFPNYLFVGAANGWYAIQNTIGVRTILMSGQTPAKVPPIIVDEIRGREDHNGFVRLPLPPRYRPGQKVGIMRGLFRGRSGVYVGMGARDRERVLIEALGRVLTVELPASDLAPPVR